MRVADFYCGAGGFSEGFRQAGFDIVFAVDKWAPAVNTFKANKPNSIVIQDDVIRISMLPDEDFHSLVPDTEIIIGSPPCVAFSNSNKSGNGDKTLGIELLKAYLRIVARKKFKENSILQYWVLENVPNIEKYIENEYKAADLGLDGQFILLAKNGASGMYNAKYYGAPTNRKRYLCGDFPSPQMTSEEKDALPLRAIMESLGEPNNPVNGYIEDCNYQGLRFPCAEISDHHYSYNLQPFEWETARRQKEDKGYMGKMSFPENLDKPARTVMATMSSSSRESMILQTPQGDYRLPTVRETATMMSFPIDYKFYGASKGIKHTLVGNSVPPKMSYALAKAIAVDAGEQVPCSYTPIQHNLEIDFLNLNGTIFCARVEKEKRTIAKFKYHVPYLIISAFRVELTNHHSDFDSKQFKWDAEIHYSQGKIRAKKYVIDISESIWDEKFCRKIKSFISSLRNNICSSHNEFQKIYCMTSTVRESQQFYGPYELLDRINNFIRESMSEEAMKELLQVDSDLPAFPNAILLGYYMLNLVLEIMKINGQERK